MRFLITGTDTSGNITLRRETAAAALKKAAELAEDGCLDFAEVKAERAAAAEAPGEAAPS
jgi:hypothetical protein